MTPILTAPFSGQRLLIVGLAREGTVAARWLYERGASVIVSDVRSADALAPFLAELRDLDIEFRLGPQTPELLTGIDALVVSPGVPQDIPLLNEARSRGIPLTGETRIFARLCPAPIIGITGSSGKTTTAMLTAEMLRASGHKIWLGGNIGAPLLGEIDAIQPDDRVTMELSSFQLLYWARQASGSTGSLPWQDRDGISPQIASVLNITPNHLDRHPSMAHYTAAKSHILEYQRHGDIAVLNLDDPVTAGWVNTGWVRIAAGPGQEEVGFPLPGRMMTFSLRQQPAGDGAWIDDGQIQIHWQGQARPIAPVSTIRLRGQHNLANILAACCLATAGGAVPDALAEVSATFAGVPHRLEEVRRRDGVLWINDSIATSPERALAALRSFDEPLILLAGGRDKHLPWQDWAAAVHQRVRYVITFGEFAGLIEQTLSPIPPSSQLQGIYHGHDLPGAVALAAQLARAGDVVLLSPGGTSYDAYSDFAARGQHFRKLVTAL